MPKRTLADCQENGFDVTTIPLGWGEVIITTGLGQETDRPIVAFLPKAKDAPLNPETVGQPVPFEQCEIPDCGVPGLEFRNFDAMRNFARNLLLQADELENQANGSEQTAD